MKNDHCVLLAGGLGTRISSVTEGKIPKALIRIGGKPFLEYKIASLVEMGFKSVDILIGEHGEQIESFVEAQKYNDLRIRCFYDGPDLLGTAGSIAAVSKHLPDCFWVTYADTYVKADIHGADVSFANPDNCIMIVLRNRNQVEPSNICVDSVSNLVTKYEKSPENEEFEYIDFGILRLSKEAFNSIKTFPCDLKEVIQGQILTQNMHAYETRELFWDIGKPERVQDTTAEFVKRGLCDRR
jgi:NDP-sugar pyrophosphorylase family protein